MENQKTGEEALIRSRRVVRFKGSKLLKIKLTCNFLNEKLEAYKTIGEVSK